MAGHFLAIAMNMQYSREILRMRRRSLTELSTTSVDKANPERGGNRLRLEALSRGPRKAAETLVGAAIGG